MDKPDWEITATTVFCDSFGDEVTLIVYADGTSRCTGRNKHIKSEKEQSRIIKNKDRQGKLPVCTEDDCLRIKQYRDEIFKS